MDNIVVCDEQYVIVTLIIGIVYLATIVLLFYITV